MIEPLSLQERLDALRDILTLIRYAQQSEHPEAYLQAARTAVERLRNRELAAATLLEYT